jgi:hypothetical protein
MGIIAALATRNTKQAKWLALEAVRLTIEGVKF